MTIHTIQQAKNANASAGFHFFDPSSLRFFGSKLPRTVFPVADGALFVTSEQRPQGSDESSPNPRLYTVRHIHDDGRTNTIGAFQGFATNDEARKVAKYLADTWGTGDRVDAVQFFYDHAGYSWRVGVESEEVGHLRTAADLARAEAWGKVVLSFVWEDDEEPGEVRCIAHLFEDVVASLGAIEVDGFTHDHRRVVEAELSYEVLAAQKPA